MPDFEKFRVGGTDYNVKDASAARLYVGSGTAPEGTNIKINPSGDAAEFVEEAPEDGKQYARQDGEWTEVTGGGGSSTPAEYVTLEQYGGGTNKTAAQNKSAFMQAADTGKNICIGSGHYTFPDDELIDLGARTGRIEITGGGNTWIGGLHFRYNITSSSQPADGSGVSNTPTIKFSNLSFAVSAMPIIITAAVVDFENCTFSGDEEDEYNCILGYAPLYIDTCVFSRCTMWQVRNVIETYLYNGTRVTGSSGLAHGDWFRFEDTVFNHDTKIMEFADNQGTKCSLNNCLHGYIKVNNGIYAAPFVEINNHHTESQTHKLIEFDGDPIIYNGHFVISNSYLYSTAVPQEECIIYDNCYINFGNSGNYAVVGKLNGSVIRPYIQGDVYYDPVSMATKSIFKSAPFTPAYDWEYYMGEEQSGGLQGFENGQTARYAVAASLKEDRLYYRGVTPTIVWSGEKTCAAGKNIGGVFYKSSNKDAENVYMHIFKIVNGTTYRCVVPVTSFRPHSDQSYCFGFDDEPDGVYGYPWGEYTGEVEYEADTTEYVEEAPINNKQYARQNGEWTEVAGGGGSNPWAGKNVLVIGDSISDPPYGDTPWQTTFATRLGCTVTNHAKAGATLHIVIDGGVIGTTGETMPALTQQDVSGKDLIILFAGSNDAIINFTPIGEVGDDSTDNTVCGYVYYAISSIYTLLASAGNSSCKIVFVTPYCIGGRAPVLGNGYAIEEGTKLQTIENQVNYLSIPCLNLYKTSGINKFTWGMYTHLNDSTGVSSGDGVHLKAAGNELIGKQIADFVKREVSI